LNKKHSIIFFIASLAVSGALFILLISIPNQNLKKSSTEVFVAARDIPSGTFIKPEMMAKHQLPTSLATPNDIKDFQEVEDLTTIIPIPKGTTVVYTQIAPTEKVQSTNLCHDPENYTLAVDEATRMGRLFKPGTKFYFPANVRDGKAEVPEAVFQNMKLVYGIEQSLKSISNPQNTIRMFTVTPTQVETLRKAAGKPLQLVLKGTNNDEISEINPRNN
jgi:Flp pilus assembly protein CpaB